MTAKLYLIPVPINENDPKLELAPNVIEIIKKLRSFVVENQRSARRFLSKIMEQSDLDSSSMEVLDEHTKIEEVSPLLKPLLDGIDVGIISEAGCPCIADPGTALVELANAKGIRVIPLPGPSSIIMGLMASGLGGQNFKFNGYLPAEEQNRIKALKKIEEISAKEGSSQIFIETPYRNEAMINTIIKCLKPNTMLCVASGISTPDEKICCKNIISWCKKPEKFAKIPTVFIILSEHDNIKNKHKS